MEEKFLGCRLVRTSKWKYRMPNYIWVADKLQILFWSQYIPNTCMGHTKCMCLYLLFTWNSNVTGHPEFYLVILLGRAHSPALSSVTNPPKGKGCCLLYFSLKWGASAGSNGKLLRKWQIQQTGWHQSRKSRGQGKPASCIDSKEVIVLKSLCTPRTYQSKGWLSISVNLMWAKWERI